MLARELHRLCTTLVPWGPPSNAPPPVRVHTACCAGFSDTWAALDRRLEDAFQLAAAAGEAGSLAGAAGGVASMLAAGVGSFFRRPPPL